MPLAQGLFVPLICKGSYEVVGTGVASLVTWDGSGDVSPTTLRRPSPVRTKVGVTTLSIWCQRVSRCSLILAVAFDAYVGFLLSRSGSGML